jgi:hypothetical protein
MERFSTRIDVRLKKVLETANKILDYELGNVFLENFTIDLMASNPDIPFTDMKFTCQILTWRIEEVKQRLQDMLRYNLPRIRIKNTDYRPFIEEEAKYQKLLTYNMDDIAEGNFPSDVPSDAYEYLHMFWDVGLSKDEDINVGFSAVPGLNIDLVGRPHDNGILRSQLVEGSKRFINFLCVNIYHFIYDVNFPVIVTIRDDKSFSGKGYIFNYAMPVTIHNNEPYKQYYGYDLFTTAYFDRGFCDERGDEIVDIRAVGREEGYSNVELNNVNISLQCFKYYCPLGLTKPDSGSYRLRTSLPESCSNPFIIAEKEGYLKSKKQLDSDKFQIEITKLKELDYEVVFHRYNSIGGIIEGAEPLEEDMTASVQILNDDISQYKQYPVDSSNVDKVEIIEGDAEYDIQVILNQGDEYIGGYYGKVKLNALDVANADKIVFHSIKYVPMPYTQEEKLKMVSYILNGEYKEQLKPVLQ